LAEQAEPALHGPEQIAWLDRLEVEHDNVRAALAWSLDGGDAGSMAGADAGVASGVRLAGAISWFWYLRHKREGLTWLERVLARSQGTATVARATALCAAGLVRREPDPDDRRASFAVITDDGRAALRKAAPVYLQGIDDEFLSHLGAGERKALERSLRKVLDAQRGEVEAAGP
jgi:DNA-binding MarR family transcriptional regulator